MLQYYTQDYPKSGQFVQIWINTEGNIWSDIYRWERNQLQVYESDIEYWKDVDIDHLNIPETSILLGYLQND